MLTEVNKENFPQEVLREKGPVLVDFWGPLCTRCLALMPGVEKMAESLSGKLKVVKINAAQNRRLCIDLRVISLPAFLMFKEGKEVGRITGNEVRQEDIGALVEKWT